MGPRKDKHIASSSRAAGKRVRTEQETTSFNRNLFRDPTRQQRFEAMKDWTFSAERRVQLAENEYPEFSNEIDRRRWRQLATPLLKFDPEVVKEFYANAWPVEGDSGRYQSKVRGHWVEYDRDSINEFLGGPMQLEPGTLCSYQRISKGHGFTRFNDDDIARELCIQGRSYETNHAGKPLRILRSNMKTLTQIWASFLMANIVPLRHSSDLNMPRCYIVYCILMKFSIDVAFIISAQIHQFVTQESGRNVEQTKALGFPALITALCAARGVEVNPTVKIRPPIDRKFIEKYCINPLEQDAPLIPQPPPEPAHHQDRPAGSSSGTHPSYEQDLMQSMQRLQLQMTHILDQQAANHRGQVHLVEHFHNYAQHTYSPIPWPNPTQFANIVQWPGDRPIFSEEATADEEQRDDDNDDEEDGGSGDDTDMETEQDNMC